MFSTFSKEWSLFNFSQNADDKIHTIFNPTVELALLLDLHVTIKH